MKKLSALFLPVLACMALAGLPGTSSAQALYNNTNNGSQVKAGSVTIPTNLPTSAAGYLSSSNAATLGSTVAGMTGAAYYGGGNQGMDLLSSKVLRNNNLLSGTGNFASIANIESLLTVTAMSYVNTYLSGVCSQYSSISSAIGTIGGITSTISGITNTLGGIGGTVGGVIGTVGDLSGTIGSFSGSIGSYSPTFSSSLGSFGC